ncbi:alpha/beta fold hydrolase [Cecembia rubra]|uniref:Proline iminopeptidase n=1 Tax=Cecembia rubra TaxID=1485585 RepID=A0A2P8E1P5_9BACT|nr:alpha/beta fold hydrolase [Cecembia rubra]PSL03369.1 proline iminopeptidase [Cecembia rubra]
MKKYLLKTTFILGLILSTIICSFGQSRLQDKSKYIDVDGARLFVRLVGSGEPLIIIHGGPGMSHDYLAPQLIDLLAKDYQLIFYDQRASGRSSGVEDTTRLTISQFVNDLDILRQQLEINRLNLLGHSFGGLLAMYYAVSYPDNVNKLLLIDTAPASWELNFPYFRKTISERQTELDRQELSNLNSKIDFETNPEIMDRYLKIYFKPFFKNSSLSQHLSLGIDKNWSSNFNVTNDMVWNSLGRYDIHEQLKNINSPTLIMHGDFSVLSIDGAKEIERMIRNSTLVILKDVGHFPYIEDPKRFNKTVRDFLKKQ